MPTRMGAARGADVSIDWSPTADAETYQAYWGCLRKVPYRERKMAKDSAAKAGRLYRRQFTTYRCDQCGWWHIASTKGKK